MNDQSNVITVVLGESDSRDILGLINAIQPDIPWTERHLRWQFFETPAGPAKLYGKRDDQNRLVAFYAATCHSVQLGDMRHTARMIQDVMTDPGYRGRGFLHDLATTCLNDIRASGEAGYTFPNEKSEGSFRRSGWHQLCTVPLRRQETSSLASDTSAERIDLVEWTSPFDHSATELWLESGLACGVVRDAAYLNWRYSKPGVAYRRYMLSDGAGYVVLKSYRNESFSALHICELLTHRAYRDRIPGMLAFCKERARELGANVVTAWQTKGHPYAAHLDRLGLRSDDAYTRKVFVMPPAAGYSDLLQPEHWHITQGDSDVY